MTPALIFTCVALYSLVLFGITWLTSRNADNESYFVGNRSSRWYLVAYGMIGASLSGVTFMSVPGGVGKINFAYFQIVLGYWLGYVVIAYVLLPLYYRMKLTSIYTYLDHRFGQHAYRTGAAFFILSRTLGAACRMYIVVFVLQKFVFDAWGIPFGVTAAVFILLILAYTFKGGVKTIVWTDTLQTTFMLLSLVLSVILIAREAHFGAGQAVHEIVSSPRSSIFVWDWKSPLFFPKAFIGGMCITIAMTGLDQEMMQKNISCRTLGDSRKNMLSFSVVMVLANLLFLVLGVLLWQHADARPELLQALKDKKMITDELFPTIALQQLGTVSAIFFIIGLISAAYPSADGALTALTASICIDFLGFDKTEKGWTDARRTRVRKIVHLSFAALLLLVMMILYFVNDRAIIDQILFLASITYGPLLGLFFFGLLTKRPAAGWGVIVVCLLAPAICFGLDFIASHDAAVFAALPKPPPPGTSIFHVFGGYRFGSELLLINGALTFIGLSIVSRFPSPAETAQV